MLLKRSYPFDEFIDDLFSKVALPEPAVILFGSTIMCIACYAGP